jgi:hypothetical protein
MCQSVKKPVRSERVLSPTTSGTLERPPIVFFVGDENPYANGTLHPFINASALLNEPSLAGVAGLLEEYKRIFQTSIWEERLHPDQLARLDPAFRLLLEAGSSPTATP